MEEEKKEEIETLGNTVPIDTISSEAVPETAPVEQAAVETAPVDSTPVENTPTPIVEAAPVPETPTIEPTVAPAETPTLAAPVEPAPIVEPAATPAPEAPKKKGKGGLILIIILLLALAGFAVWYFVLGGNESKKEEPKKEEEQQEEKKEEEQQGKKEEEEEPKKEEEKKTIDLSVAKEIHANYESKAGDITRGLYIEKIGYDLSNADVISYSFSAELYERIKDDLQEFAVVEEGSSGYVPADKARPIIKKAFDEFFGHVVEYSDDYFSHESSNDLLCLFLQYNKEKDTFNLAPMCGLGLITVTIDTEVESFEIEDKYLYVYEKATISEPDPSIPVETLYSKWTYVKQSDNNYYFLKAEPFNK